MRLFDFKPGKDASTAEINADLCEAVDALTQGEPDGVANMANCAALIWDFLPDLNWAGFYRVAPAISEERDELVLGPFMGRPACIRIPFGQGVCGAAAQSGQTQLVEDVHAFPGHIACDALSRSELVVPILKEAKVIGVIDLDSPSPSRFTAEDAAGIERIAAILSERL